MQSQGRKYPLHRVIWLMVHGSFPDSDTDHENGTQTDNRLSNLRACFHAENGKNRKRNSNNRSGAMGVYWHKLIQKWCAKIKVNGRDKHLGSFTNKVDAIAARAAADIRYGYHYNHGRGRK